VGKEIKALVVSRLVQHFLEDSWISVSIEPDSGEDWESNLSTVFTLNCANNPSAVVAIGGM
jgi:hypothetical protein